MQKRTNVIEAKVKVSSLAAAASGAVLALVSHVVGADTANALAGTIETIVTAAVTGGVTFAGGWLAKHTPREFVEVENSVDKPRY